MEYIFDLCIGDQRQDTTTKANVALDWLANNQKLPNQIIKNTINILTPRGGNLRFTDEQSLKHYLDDDQIAHERAFAWKPERAEAERVVLLQQAGLLPKNDHTTNVNLKNAAGAKKAPLHPVPPIAFIALGQAMADGKAKYELYNWRESEATISVFYDAMERHLLAYLSGENHAKDSKVHHLAHVMASCAILLDAELHGKLIDDRHHINGKVIEDMLAVIKTK